MRNDELEILQSLSKRVVDGMPLLLLRGDGRFLDEGGQVIASSEVLERLHVARQCAVEMAGRLSGVKRRVVNKEPKDAGKGPAARAA
jgi:hypothetical protein